MEILQRHDAATVHSTSFKSKIVMTGKNHADLNTKDAEISVPLK